MLSCVLSARFLRLDAGNVSDPALRQAGRLNVSISFPKPEGRRREGVGKGNSFILESAYQVSAKDGVAYMVESIPKVNE